MITTRAHLEKVFAEGKLIEYWDQKTGEIARFEDGANPQEEMEWVSAHPSAILLMAVTAR